MGHRFAGVVEDSRVMLDLRVRRHVPEGMSPHLDLALHAPLHWAMLGGCDQDQREIESPWLRYVPFSVAFSYVKISEKLIPRIDPPYPLH